MRNEIEEIIMQLGAKRIKNDTSKIALLELNHKHFAIPVSNKNSYNVYTEDFMNKEQFINSCKKIYEPGNSSINSNIKAYPSRLQNNTRRYYYQFETLTDLKQFLIKYSES